MKQTISGKNQGHSKNTSHSVPPTTFLTTFSLLCKKPALLGREQLLRGAGKTLRRYPTPKGKGEAPVRW